jgi:hypothetical protein
MSSPAKPILVKARPEPLSIDPKRTAMIVVDMQNDFGSEGGMFALEDCTAEPIGQDLPRSNHDASLLVLQILFGWVARSGDLIRALESKQAPSHA